MGGGRVRGGEAGGERMKRGERIPIEIRLERRKSVNSLSGCWEWLGSIDRNGYGRIAVEGPPRKWKTGYVHRVSWEHAHGQPVPPGLVVDHVCENRRCFNPDHLEAVEPQVNLNRAKGAPANRTHCPQGHRYAGANLRIHVDHKGHRRRICITCQNTRNAQYRVARLATE